MSRLSMISPCVGMLALITAGCSGSSGNKVSTVATPSSVPEVKSPVVQPLTGPPIGIQSPGTIAAAPGLIQPTNPNERAKQVVKGRPDPFGLLPGEAVPIAVNPPTFQTVVNRSPILAIPQRLPTMLQPPSLQSSAPRLQPPVPRLPELTPIPKNNGNAGSQFNPRPGNLLPPSPSVSLPPPLPQADVAKSVAVTGVVQVGDQIEAIVKVPNEATSRYVKVGQRLSNGQVLVKRIEMNQGSNPVVILEQYGIEVARAVGEEPVNPAPTAKPTAALPSTPNSRDRGTNDISAMSQPATENPSTPPLVTNELSVGESGDQ